QRRRTHDDIKRRAFTREPKRCSYWEQPFAEGPMTSLRLLSAPGLVLLLAAARPVAAERAPEKAEPPVFGSDLSLVALPVFVVDKQGGAMRGLSAADFELLDDG